MLLFWWDLQQIETFPYSLSGNSAIQLQLIPRSSNVDCHIHSQLLVWIHQGKQALFRL